MPFATLVTAVIFGFFVVFGFLAVEADVISSWLGRSPEVLATARLGGQDKRLEDLRHDVGRGDEVDVVAARHLQFEHDRRQLLR